MSTIRSTQKSIAVKYNHKDIQAELATQIKGWSHTDNLSGQIDDLQLVLEDVKNVWMKEWFPQKTSTINASILNTLYTNKSGKTQTFNTKLGNFEIDEIDGANPGTITLKASALSQASSLKGEHKSKAWEKVTPQKVFADIAKVNGMKLYYQANETDKLERVEQESETDLAFLYRFANEHGLCLKITNKSIVVLDESDYENNTVKDTIRLEPLVTDDIKVLDWNFRSTLTGVYRACKVKNQDSTKKKVVQAVFTPPNPPKVGRVLVVKADVKNESEALKVAKKRLREANKNGDTVNLTVDSNVRIDAGNTYQLRGFGRMSGKYIVTQVIDGDGPIQVSLRRCLEGY